MLTDGDGVGLNRFGEVAVGGPLSGALACWRSSTSSKSAVSHSSLAHYKVTELAGFCGAIVTVRSESPYIDTTLNIVDIKRLPLKS